MRIDGNTPISSLMHSDILEEDELQHHGVKGMKWGVRRYQNKDGSLTKAGKTRYKLGVEKSEYKNMNRQQRRQLKKDYYNTAEGAEATNKITRNTIIGTIVGGPVVGLAVGLATVKKIEDNVPPKSSDKSVIDGKKAADNAIKKIADEPVSLKKVTTADIESRFTTDEFGSYYSRIRADIGDAKGVEISVDSRKGNETASAAALTKFLKRYDVNKAKEGVVKEHYDKDEYSWIGKNPGDDNYYTRTDFKDKAKLSYLNVDPDNDTYTAYWYDGGTYGGHFFVDEGSVTDMKVRRRYIEG